MQSKLDNSPNMNCPRCDSVNVQKVAHDEETLEVTCVKCGAQWLTSTKDVAEPEEPPRMGHRNIIHERIAGALERIATALEIMYQPTPPRMFHSDPPIPDPPGERSVEEEILKIFSFDSDKRQLKGADYSGKEKNEAWLEEE